VTVSPETLHGEVLDSLQTLTIFVAFVTVLFGLRYPEISKILRQDLPDKETKSEARRIAKKNLHTPFWSQCLVLVILTVIPAYLFLPLSIRIMAKSRFSLWDFDTLETGFLLLTAYLIVFFGWSLYLGIRFADKTYRK
jgi:sterol desaturase/sphingolipid hydroxylase (fatty acid hydroxylase superfamily)